MNERRPKNFLLEHKKEIINLYDSGMSLNEIGREFSCESSSLSRFFSKLGIKTRETVGEKLLRLRPEIEKLYRGGLGAGEIAIKFDVNLATLQGYFYRWKSRSPRRRDDLEQKKVEIIDLYREGWGTHRLGKKFNAAANVIKRRLDEWGIIIRDQREGCIHRYHDPEERRSIGKRTLLLHKDPIFKERFIRAVVERSENPEYLKKVSLSLKGKYTGERASGWKGGLSFQDYPPEFNQSLKDRIRERDSYACRLCKITEEESLERWRRKLSVHHIDYDKRHCEETNLTTLCFICNIGVNKDRDFWMNTLSIRSKEELRSLMGSERFYIDEEDGSLYLIMGAFHQQVLPFFPQYNPTIKPPATIVKYSDPQNAVGHQQRGFLCYWALRAFIEHGVISLELGSAGVTTPMALSLDIVGNGQTPQYGGGPMTGVHFKGDGANLSMFGTGSFSAVLSSHYIEHVRCVHLRGHETPQERSLINCSGVELLHTFKTQWLRVIKPGGYFCAIFPEEGAARRAGHSVFQEDPLHHQHAFEANRFHRDIITPLVNANLVELIQFNTFQNEFSAELVLRVK